MEGARSVFHRENNSHGGLAGAAAKGDRNPNKMALLMGGSAVRRKRLSDITNTSSDNGRTTAMRSNNASYDSTENAKLAPSAATKEYMEQLLKENTALLRLLGERNQIIELSGVEMQKLRFTLQKTNQQNYQLAQANSQMLAEVNVGKERLKAMQLKCACTEAALKVKTLELEEYKKLRKQPNEIKHEASTNLDSIVVDADRPASPNKAFNLNKKRTLRNKSLGSATMTNQVTAKEKDESRRKSVRRRRSSNLKMELCEPSDDLFEIGDLELPNHSFANDPMREDSSAQIDTSAHSVSYEIKTPVEEEEKDKSESSVDQNQGGRRSSVGRPLRKAAVKVSSYKEVPLNAKMRRDW